MPKDSRARTRAVRDRMTATGESYTQAAAALAAPSRMNRDQPPAGPVVALMFAELMAAGRRAAIAQEPGLPAEAAAAVQSALTPLWSHVVPEAARDVLVTCAQIAVSCGITNLANLPAGAGSITAQAMLDLTAEWVAAGSPGPGARPTPPVAYASSAAFDRDEDAETFAAVALLLAVAHPARLELDDGEDDPWPRCPECGSDDPQGEYGCVCWDPSACSECGDNSSTCGCGA
jgi:hypothetical protein